MRQFAIRALLIIGALLIVGASIVLSHVVLRVVFSPNLRESNYVEFAAWMVGVVVAAVYHLKVWLRFAHP